MASSFTKRILSLLLCAMMLIGLLPITVFATETGDEGLQDTKIVVAASSR